MSTPTTVKFQIAVSSNDENGLTEKTYFVEMGLSVETDSGEPVSIRLEPLPAPPLESSGLMMVPLDAIPPPEDPPKMKVVISPIAN